MKEITIREMEVEDVTDVHHILQLTSKRFISDPRFDVGPVEDIQGDYLGQKSSLCFVAAAGEAIVAFMGISYAEETGNAYLRYGYQDDYAHALQQLVDRCVSWIRSKGGNKLFYFAPTPFGQIRNQEIAMFEQLGFVSDEYTETSTHLVLDYWKEPEQIDLSRIVPTAEIDPNEFYEILAEDGEIRTAARFKEIYSDRSKNRIILGIEDRDTNRFAGFAYYKVSLVHPSHPKASAVGFGLHFRPEINLSMEDKRRLLQAALLSMKQLDLHAVTTLLTLKNFETFVILINEGFVDFLANTIRLTKDISHEKI